MITLIAESKTMKLGDDVDAGKRENNIPAGEATANEVMANILEMTAPEIATEMKVSHAMASKILKMAYDFPAKDTGLPAIEAFTGVVFKALGYESLSEEGKEYVNKDVRIISSLYGWLRPEDMVKPYRMEYTTRLAPSDLPFSAFWRKEVTIHLVKAVKASNTQDIINLLPGDAEKCIDKKLVKGFARIWKVDFKIFGDGGSLRTPSSGRLKELRGSLLREMAERNVTTPDELKTLASPLFLPLGTPDYPDHILFGVE